MQQRKNGKSKVENKAKAGFDWNWKNSNSIDDESYLLLEKQQPIFSHQHLRNTIHSAMALCNKFRSDWIQIWHVSFPDKTSRVFALALFWLSSLLCFLQVMGYCTVWLMAITRLRMPIF